MSSRKNLPSGVCAPASKHGPAESSREAPFPQPRRDRDLPDANLRDRVPKTRGMGGPSGDYTAELTFGKTKVCFATDYPLLQWDRVLAEVDGLALPPDVERRFLHDNALAAFNLKV